MNRYESGALAGLRVLDLSTGSAGAMTTMVLSDNGAEVLRVERPGGDLTRAQPAWTVWNRGKTVVERDLTDPSAMSEVQRLANQADIVVESWRPAVAERLGLGYDSLRAANPGLVYCSITGFGRAGPDATVKGYEGLVAARSGVMMRGGEPRFAAVPGASFAASQGALIGILAALYERSGTGRGQRVDTSLARAISAFDLYGWLHLQVVAPKTPDGTPDVRSSAPMIYASISSLLACTADGRWIKFTNSLPHQLDSFIEALGIRAEYEAALTAGRPPAEVDELALRRLYQLTLAEWSEIFDRHPDVTYEPVRTAREAMVHPQVIHNGHVMSVERDLEEEGPPEERVPVRGVGPLVQFLDAPAPALTRPRQLDPAEPVGFSTTVDELALPTGSAATAGGNRLPLEGVCVLELGWFYAAPFGLACLADLGARVIKVETLAGDPFRRQSVLPELAAVKCMQGKQSICLDLKTAEGKEILADLVRRSDVVMRSFRQEQSEAIGVDEPSLRRMNPDLIYLYAGAYGDHGPWSRRAAYATTMEAAVGYLACDYGWDSALDDPAMVPQTFEEADAMRTSLSRLGRAPFANGDAAAALAVATAALLGLVAQKRTGRGPNLRTTMLCTNAYVVSGEFVDAAPAADTPRHHDPANGLSATYRIYRAASGAVFLACPQQREWARLCSSLRSRLGGVQLYDPRFATPAARAAHDRELADLLSGIFAQMPASEWETLLTAADVGCVELDGRTLSYFTIFGPGATANGTVGEVEHTLFGHHLRHGPLAALSGSTWRPQTGCLAGEHTRSILSEMGYDSATIDSLEQRKIVGCGAGRPR
jgi:crotonobetainyl-CoA:carnitine CoA-transferase CaiB-like acyl-CoA transferase